MRLYEFEGKQFLSKHGIPTPAGYLIKNMNELHNPITQSAVVKAHVLAGKRGKAGAVRICETFSEMKEAVSELLNSEVRGELVETLLIEDIIQATREFYLGITYDTEAKKPVIILSAHGGIDVEELAEKSVIKKHVDPLLGIQDWQAREIAVAAGLKEKKILLLAEIVKKLYKCFVAEDARLLEINPLAETNEGFVAVDARIELDDFASFRHKEQNYSLVASRKLTEREEAVKKANEKDYRGTVKYIELDGDIGFLAAGGGGSITCMDALIGYGGKPSNYTEYSGNPPKEKVYELTKQILSKPLNGLWIVGAIANFTRVDTTMEGVIEALLETKPDFPIVVRRSGPFEKEGLELLRNAAIEHGLDMEIHGKEMPMTQSAKIIVEKSMQYKLRKK